MHLSILLLLSFSWYSWIKALSILTFPVCLRKVIWCQLYSTCCFKTYPNPFKTSALFFLTKKMKLHKVRVSQQIHLQLYAFIHNQRLVVREEHNITNISHNIKADQMSFVHIQFHLKDYSLTFMKCHITACYWQKTDKVAALVPVWQLCIACGMSHQSWRS